VFPHNLNKQPQQTTPPSITDPALAELLSEELPSIPENMQLDDAEQQQQQQQAGGPQGGERRGGGGGDASMAEVSFQRGVWRSWVCGCW